MYTVFHCASLIPIRLTGRHLVPPTHRGVSCCVIVIGGQLVSLCAVFKVFLKLNDAVLYGVDSVKNVRVVEFPVPSEML